MKSTPEEIMNNRCYLESPRSLGRTGVPHIYQPHILPIEGQNILIELFIFIFLHIIYFYIIKFIFIYEIYLINCCNLIL